jgi:hypothetical protein
MEKTTNLSLRIPIETKREIERIAPTLGHSSNSLAAFWVNQAVRRHLVGQQIPANDVAAVVSIGDRVEWTQPDIMEGVVPAFGKVYEVTSVKGSSREQQIMIRDETGGAVVSLDGPWWWFTDQFRIVTRRVL